VNSDSDQDSAAKEQAARQRLLAAGGSALPRPPWTHRSQPPAAVDLVRFAVWRLPADGADEVVDAALSLLAAARAEVEQLETAMLFAARAHGMSWARISRAMGLGSAQAALQRYNRLVDRVESRTEA
jgi:hypothetical protein